MSLCGIRAQELHPNVPAQRRGHPAPYEIVHLVHEVGIFLLVDGFCPFIAEFIQGLDRLFSCWSCCCLCCCLCWLCRSQLSIECPPSCHLLAHDAVHVGNAISDALDMLGIRLVWRRWPRTLAEIWIVALLHDLNFVDRVVQRSSLEPLLQLERSPATDCLGEAHHPGCRLLRDPQSHDVQLTRWIRDHIPGIVSFSLLRQLHAGQRHPDVSERLLGVGQGHLGRLAPVCHFPWTAGSLRCPRISDGIEAADRHAHKPDSLRLRDNLDLQIHIPHPVGLNRRGLENPAV
mmetsp:Transcript_35489/g.57143  ORF Transcript_35489/g.57143 Transcript_35489/m.57143 type:complete len:289 (-) Transcript_35489:1558-2424(-)